VVRASNRVIPLDADSFRIAADAIEASKSSDTECLNPDTTLSQLFRQAGRSDLKAHRDENARLVAHGYAPGADGTRCEASFVPTGKRSQKGQPTFNAWSSGAEFTIGTATKQKKKRKAKRGKGDAAMSAASPVAAGCGAQIYSGPLVRIPISEDDFDRLWTAKAA
jgi:hypothetical protein